MACPCFQPQIWKFRVVVSGEGWPFICISCRQLEISENPFSSWSIADGATIVFVARIHQNMVIGLSE